MEKKPKDLSLSLARRQKRLQYWKNWFKNEKKTDSKFSRQINDLLKLYSKTLYEYANCSDQDEQANYEKSISSLERKLESLFTSRRLVTSKIGIPAVGEV